MTISKTSSYVPLTPRKVTDIINRIRPAITKYRGLDDERNIRTMRLVESEKRVFLFFKRRQEVSRETAISALKNLPWFHPLSYGGFPSTAFRDEERLCNNLETAVAALGHAPNEHLMISIADLATLERAYVECKEFERRCTEE